MSLIPPHIDTLGEALIVKPYHHSGQGDTYKVLDCEGTPIHAGQIVITIQSWAWGAAYEHLQVTGASFSHECPQLNVITMRNSTTGIAANKVKVVDTEHINVIFELFRLRDHLCKIDGHILDLRQKKAATTVRISTLEEVMGTAE